MQPLAGIVVEYLVVGSTSALWILIFLATFDRLPKSLPDTLLVVLIPLLYVFGMLSDRLGRFLVERQKKILEKQIQKDHGHRPVSTQDVSSRLIVHLPALAEQLEARRTRDRISRGVLANVPFVTLAVGVWLGRDGPVWTVLVVGIGGVLLYVGVWLMWKRYQTLSSTYEIHCDERLRELQESGAPRASGST
jgi:hypothetical protein